MVGEGVSRATAPEPLDAAHPRQRQTAIVDPLRVPVTAVQHLCNLCRLEAGISSDRSLNVVNEHGTASLPSKRRKPGRNQQTDDRRRKNPSKRPWGRACCALLAAT